MTVNRRFQVNTWGGHKDDWEPELSLPVGMLLLSKAIESFQYWRKAHGISAEFEPEEAWAQIRRELVEGRIQSYAYGEFGHFIANIDPSSWLPGGSADLGVASRNSWEVSMTKSYYWYVELESVEAVGIVVISDDDFRAFLANFRRQHPIGSSASVQVRAVGGGGRPGKHDWEGLLIEMAAQIFEGRVPAKQSDLTRMMLDWFGPDNEPSPSQVRERAKKLFDRISRL